MSAALALRRRRRRGHAARAPPAPGRRHLVVRAPRRLVRQRPARVPALLHGVPGVPRLASGVRRRRASRTASTIPCVAPGGPVDAHRAATPLPAPLHLGAALLGYRHLTGRRAAGRPCGRAARCGGSTPTTRRSTSDRSATGSPTQGERPRPSRGCGTSSPDPRSTCPRRRVAGPRRDGVPHRSALRQPRRRHRLRPRAAGGAARRPGGAAPLRAPGASIHTDAPVVGIERGVDGTVCGRRPRRRARRRRRGRARGPPRRGRRAAAERRGAGLGPPARARRVADRQRAPRLRPPGDRARARGRRSARRCSGCSTAPPPSGIDEGQCLAVSLSAADE